MTPRGHRQAVTINWAAASAGDRRCVYRTILLDGRGMKIGDDGGVLHVLHGGDRSLLVARFATKESGSKGGKKFNNKIKKIELKWLQLQQKVNIVTITENLGFIIVDCMPVSLYSVFLMTL